MSRILFLQHDSVFERYGGIQYYLHDVVESTHQLLGGNNVRTLIPRRREVLLRHPETYSVEFVGVANRGWRKKLHNRFPGPLFRKGLSLIRQFSPTLLVCGHVNLGLLAYTLHKWTGVPYATTVYGTDCWGHLWPQDEWCLRRASRIFSISHWTKDILVGRGYAPEQIRIIHPRLSEEYESLPSARQPGEVFTLLTVSRLEASEQYKGQDHVLRALAKLRTRKPDARIRYIIQGEGSDRARLQHLVGQLGLKEWVEFRDPVRNRVDLVRTYREADLYVMPSRFGRWDGQWRGEGFGIVYVEAAIFELPSVAYRCGGVLDIIESGKNGVLVEPDDIEALSQALEELMQNPEKRKRMGETARQMALQRFTREPIKEQIQIALEGF